MPKRYGDVAYAIRGNIFKGGRGGTEPAPRPRALWRNSVTMDGGGGAGLLGGTSGAAIFFAAGFGAVYILAAGVFFGSDARRFGLASPS
jgi:hypothetical protein